MSWWWKARQWPMALVAGLISVGLVWLVGESLFSLPLSTGITAPQAFVVPVAVPLAVARCLGRASFDERRTVRQVYLWDLAIVWPLAAACAMGMVLTNPGAVGLTAGRNVLALTGFLLLCARLMGARYASLMPVGWLFLSALFGSSDSGSVHPWAWPLAPSSTLTWAGTAVLVVLGSVALAWISPTTRAGRRRGPDGNAPGRAGRGRRR